jgi:hypothetical protein
MTKKIITRSFIWWDETISLFPKKCIITRLFLWYLFFENVQDNYDKKKWFVPRLRFRNKEYLWNGFMNFSEILNFSSRDKEKQPEKSGKFVEPFRSGPGWVKQNISSFWFPTITVSSQFTTYY